MFEPTCCETLMLAATRPSPVISMVRSGAPCWTVATSETRMVVPPLTTSGVGGMSSSDFHSPDASTRCCRPPAVIAADRLQLVRGLERVGDVADGQAGGGRAAPDRR